MREIWVADSETDPFKAGRVPTPFIWGLTNGIDYYEFDDTEKFIEFCSNVAGIIYAHNGGKFDWHYILHRLEAFSPLTVIAGRLAKFTIGAAEFRDSYNILPLPLAAWKKDDFDYNLMESDLRDIPENRVKIQKYLKNDCFYLHELVMEFIDRYGVSLTVAGSAMKMWQKISEEKAPKTNQMFYDRIADYYYGGRVECFKSGIIEKKFSVIDINSAYPYAMVHDHPWGESFVTSTSLPDTRGEIERSFITLRGVARGALPYRGKLGLEFPTDNIEREYNITGWEFLAACETNSLEKWEIETVLIFPDKIDFVDYVDHFFNQKTEAKETDDTAGYIFAKLFLNSLYGKFAANPDKYREFMVVPPRHIEAAETDNYKFCAEVGGKALVSKPIDEEDAHYYNVATAASITGFVRAYLWRAIHQCDGVMYCDTDSIAAESIDGLELHPTTLGAWDVEAECNLAGIGGKKLYAFRKLDGAWKTASKGVRLSSDEIMSVAGGETVEYVPESPTYSLKRGIVFTSRKVAKTA